MEKKIKKVSVSLEEVKFPHIDLKLKLYMYYDNDYISAGYSIKNLTALLKSINGLDSTKSGVRESASSRFIELGGYYYPDTKEFHIIPDASRKHTEEKRGLTAIESRKDDKGLYYIQWHSHPFNVTIPVNFPSLEDLQLTTKKRAIYLIVCSTGVYVLATIDNTKFTHDYAEKIYREIFEFYKDPKQVEQFYQENKLDINEIHAYIRFVPYEYITPTESGVRKSTEIGFLGYLNQEIDNIYKIWEKLSKN